MASNSNISVTERQQQQQPSAYSTLNRALTTVYPLNWEVIAYGLILVIAILTRFWDLGARVMSHDESLHVYYSWQLFDRGDFDHTPLMHGPVIFHLTALSYFLFGVNDFTARIYAALLGTLMVIFPYLFRKWLGKTGAVLTSIGILISPMLLYYSRYIREDIPMLFYMLVMTYAIMQYLDNDRPRRPVWLAVMGSSMLLMLASKEVAFMNVALMGSFFMIYWIMRMVQGFVFHQRDSDVTPSEKNTSETVLWLLGEAFTLGAAVGLGHHIGYMIWQFWVVNTNPTPIPRRLIELAVALALFFLFHAMGAIGLATRGKWLGLPEMFANGFRNPASLFKLMVAGFILAGVMSIILFSVLDIIKPEHVWEKVDYNTRINEEALKLDDPIQQQEYLQTHLPQTGQKIGITSLEFNTNKFQVMLTWIGIPFLLIVFLIMLLAIFNSPRGRFAWQDLTVILLIAIVFTGFFLLAEQKSVASHEHQRVEERLVKERETQEQQLKDRLGTAYVAPEVEEEINNKYIILSWLVGALVTILVIGTRLLTNWWDYLNRQPIFDILIVLGSMILPWLAAVPIFAAGYNLDQIPLGDKTVDAAIATSIPFFMVSISVGLAWNWRWWPIAAVAFWLPFAVFFTTFFSNGNGLGTGVIGSLGYWLEQQGVRRGSQPQYYYSLIQVPFYEFMFAIIASIAAFYGIGRLFAFRAASQDQADMDEIPTPADATLTLDDTEELPAGSRKPLGHYVTTYDHDHEVETRRRYVEYLGEMPFLLFMGYWAIVIFMGLTLAGEKMPWLTTHITLPLIFISGWFMGKVLEGIKWSALKAGGWLLIVVIMPVLSVALVELILPYFTGESVPFAGRNLAQLEKTGQWLAALLATLTTGYFFYRVAIRVGYDQTRRIVFSSLVLMMSLLTARQAWMESYTYYDYSNGFLNYAHGGPAVKYIMTDLDYLAERHPDGKNMVVVYDEESTWPLVWYLRGYTNLKYVTKDSVKSNPGQMDGAMVVLVGEQKNADVERILGDNYFRFDYIRLWWPMQDYFDMNFEDVEGFVSSNDTYPASSGYRRGIWDIWWQRDYRRYNQGGCIEQRQSQCDLNTDVEKIEYDDACLQRIRNECQGQTNRFDVRDWPVRDKIFMYVQKDFAVKVWDTGLDGKSVAERLVPDPENAVQVEIAPLTAFGTGNLNNPHGITVDADGNIFVADTKNNRIVSFDSNGNFRSTLGEGMLKEPWSVSVNAVNGNLYVADTWNERVVIFSPEGEVLQTFGHHSSPQSPDYNTPEAMYAPRGLTTDLEGLVYVVDTGGHRVRVYDQNMVHIRDFGSQGSNLGQMLEPVGIAIHPTSGEAYVAETWNQRVSVFNRQGAVLPNSWQVNMWKGTTTIDARPFIAISPDGSLVLVSDMDANGDNNGPRVVAYDLSGQAIQSFNAPGNSTEFVGAVAGLTFTKDGRLLVVDSANGRVVVFPPLTVSGNIAAFDNPSYAPDNRPDVNAGTGNTNSNTSSDQATANVIGQQYWNALTQGNYSILTTLYCPESLPSENAFNLTISPQYRTANISELIVISEINGDSGIIRFDGTITIIAENVDDPNDDSRKFPASQIQPLNITKINGRWQICDQEIFRPGGQ